MRELAVLATLAMAGAIGCDAPHGIYRSASVKTMPSFGAVGAALRAVRGVDSVRSLRCDARGTCADSSQNVSFAYWGVGGAWGFIQFLREPSRITFSDHLSKLGDRPRQREVDVTLRLMPTIERQLAALPGLSDLPQNVTQKCIGVSCP